MILVKANLVYEANQGTPLGTPEITYRITDNLELLQLLER